MKRSERVRYAVAGFKILTGALEVAAGIALLAFPVVGLQRFVDDITRGTTRFDPNHPVISWIQEHAASIISRKSTIAIVLLILGAIKLIGAIGLIKHKPWAYYLLVASLIVLLPPDVIHIIHKPNALAIVLLVANVVVLALLLKFRRAMIAHETGQH